jgi:hypothetical protein
VGVLFLHGKQGKGEEKVRRFIRPSAVRRIFYAVLEKSQTEVLQ